MWGPASARHAPGDWLADGVAEGGEVGELVTLSVPPGVIGGVGVAVCEGVEEEDGRVLGLGVAEGVAIEKLKGNVQA